MLENATESDREALLKRIEAAAELLQAAQKALVSQEELHKLANFESLNITNVLNENPNFELFKDD
jgi:hypothetical protein